MSHGKQETEGILYLMRLLRMSKYIISFIYSSRAHANDFQEDFFPPTSERLNEESQLHCEGLVSSKECLDALNYMSPGKSPGTDGLPCEFYITFWKDIGDTLTAALNFSYNTGNLPTSQRRGIKDQTHLAPFDLLNCDYKIATKPFGISVSVLHC